MALQKITEEQIEQKQIASLPDRMTGTAAENKAAFDALVKCAIDAFNALVDTLAATGGAGEIGAEPFTGVGEANTVQEQIRALQANIAGAAQGAIPDGSVTSAKIADAAVTALKLANTSVTAAKLAANSVTEAKLLSGAVTADKLAEDAVTQAKLADGAVTTSKLASGAVTQTAIAGGSIPDNWLASPMLKIATGSYTGTGTQGQSTPNTAEIGFAAKVFVICGDTESFLCIIRPSTLAYDTKGSQSTNHFTWFDTKVTWYNSYKHTIGGEPFYNPGYQFNEADQKYYWVAIG